MTLCNLRLDGLSERNAKVVCEFQRIIETSPAPDYDALRAALKWARERNDCQITMLGLRARYNDCVNGWMYN